MTTKRNLVRVALLFAAVSLFGAGCFGSSSTGPTGPDGGVWKSADGGETWANERAFVSGPKVTADAATFQINQMAFDPQDHKTIYLATAAHGLEYSLDGGSSWQQGNIPNVTTVGSVAVDPKNKCTVYATGANRIYKTENCGRDWEQIFYEPRSSVSFTQIIVDWYDPINLYAGTSDGDVFKSTDAGKSWQRVDRIDGVRVMSLAMDPHDSRVVYAGTETEGILKTADGGLTWTQIKKQFGQDLIDGRRVVQVVVDPADPSTIYDVCRYGILKSTDGGDTWTALNLTSPPNTVKIKALAIDPKNTQHLIYTGVATLQFTTDGGKTWTPKRLPTTQSGSALLIDPIDSNVLYLGTTVPPSKN